ncbi:MAG: cytochrome b pre-mRNA-processing protein 3 [Alphaproteobacteria bacterium]|nr:cytochrome b pre-mRNA-processing protein 3 [Alphaproteobacteria bacterium]
MKSPLFRRIRRPEIIAALYGMIVAQARSPAFYRALAVPDTVNGRLEMLLLHTFLFVRRLRSEPEPIRVLGQEVFDLFCQDIDGNLREMRVGDLAVPGQMRQIGEAFYGRAAVYDAALVAGDAAALEEALIRNVFSGPSAGARCLAAYMSEAVRCLATQGAADFSQGRIVFPDPELLTGADHARDLVASR